MSVSLTHFLFGTGMSTTPEAVRYREIENHYRLAVVADNAKQLVDFQTTALQLQARAAGLNLRGMSEIAQRQDVTNDHLAALVDGIDVLADRMEQMNEGMDALNATATATLDAVREQTDVLREGFSLIAERLLAEHKVLLDIAKTLRSPYETQMLELREQADKWLKQGMLNTGREQDDDYDDAMRLLQEVIKNPIGNQDYVTWFQIGWLFWRHSAKMPDAEQAFYRASRLSAPQANLYHSLSVRHLAYMQYLQDRHEEAFQTMRKVVNTSPDHDILFDAARYAAKTGRKAEALAWLEKCIELLPATIVTMFAEEDFKA